MDNFPINLFCQICAKNVGSGCNQVVGVKVNGGKKNFETGAAEEVPEPV